MVAGVDTGQEDFRIRGIAGHLVEINHPIKNPARPNPVVDGFPGLFTGRGSIAGAPVGGERRAEDFDSVGMRAGDKLGQSEGERRSELGSRQCILTIARPRDRADVVDAFKNDQVADAALRQYIAVEAGERVLARSIAK